MIHWGEPTFSLIIAGAFLGLMTLVWAALALGVGQWGRRWRLTPGPPPAEPPRLSICVPARNEAGRIGVCVQAALASDYPALEVVVVDDRSTDGTAAEAILAAAGDPRFRLIEGTDPPPGWAGKPWACVRAAGEASGELLLFIDADVRIAPWAISAAVSALTARRLSLLSLFGDWDLRGFWELAVIPVIGWFIRGSVDLDAVNDPGRPEAFANGQFILVTREAYDRVGGHGVVKAEVLDDVRLARAIKQRAMPCGLLHAPGAFSARLYRGLGEIVSGYSKNLYEGMDRQPVLAAGAVLFVFVSTLSPYVALAVIGGGRLLLGWHLVSWPWVLWILGICLLIHVFRWRLERQDGRSGWHALSHPLGNLVFVWVLLRSIFSIEAQWKGRRFVDGKAG